MGDILVEYQEIIFAHKINDEPLFYLPLEEQRENKWTLNELDISLLMM